MRRYVSFFPLLGFDFFFTATPPNTHALQVKLRIQGCHSALDYFNISLTACWILLFSFSPFLFLRVACSTRNLISDPRFFTRLSHRPFIHASLADSVLFNFESQARLSCTSFIHASRTRLAYTPFIHASHTRLSCYFSASLAADCKPPRNDVNANQFHRIH